MSELDDRVRDHFEGSSLSPEALERMKALAAGAPAVTAPPLEGWTRGLLALAAVLLVFLGLSGVLGQRLTIYTGPSSAQEIAANHSKQEAVAFAPDSYEELKANLTRLDFAPFEPERVKRAKLRLVGARYCSVGGRIAAQVQLTDATGTRMTLYVYRPGPGFVAGQHEVDGVTVSLWQERGLAFGLAHGSAD